MPIRCDFMILEIDFCLGEEAGYNMGTIVR